MGIRLLLAAALVTTGVFIPAQPPAAPLTAPPWEAFLATGGRDDREARRALDAIGSAWRDVYAAMLIDVARLLPSPRTGALGRSEDGKFIDSDDPVAGGRTGPRGDFPTTPSLTPGAIARRRITTFLEKQTRQRFGDDLRAWRRWAWALEEPPHPDLALFKAALYAQIDPGFRSFFPRHVATAIRLDEIDWGGVGVNGIPPLRMPAVLPAAQATYLRDGHLVFGLHVNGEARAYPKRILAWHEMAIDRVGGVDITLVYCTLCGTVIPFESRVGDRTFAFGTSGLLYRSNKLMFDEQTRSLWSALDGVPVVGPLVGKKLRLAVRPVVTTTWGEWRREHPATSVLSIDTGFERDYAEGAAYREYFSHDRLMFEVPSTDTRLRNKAEVLVLRREVLGGDSPPVAIAVDLLKRQRVFAVEAGGRRLVVLTSKNGANRVYDRGGREFAGRDPDVDLRDADGGRWTVTAEALVHENGDRLPRVAAHRAFWFGWYAQYPDTVLHR